MELPVNGWLRHFSAFAGLSLPLAGDLGRFGRFILLNDGSTGEAKVSPVSPEGRGFYIEDKETGKQQSLKAADD